MPFSPLSTARWTSAVSAQPTRNERESLRRDLHPVGACLVRPGDNGGALEQVERDLRDRALARFGEEAARGPPVEGADGGPGPELVVGPPRGVTPTAQRLELPRYQRKISAIRCLASAAARAS